MNKNIFCAFCFFLSSFLLAAQNDKGYSLSFRFDGLPDKTLYLLGYYGDGYHVVDSGRVKKNQVRFQRKEQLLPTGFYQLANKDGYPYLEFLVEKSRNFFIATTLGNPYFTAEVNNSEENRLFFEYMKHALSDDGTLDLFTEDLLSLSGNSLLGLYLKTIRFQTNPPSVDIAESEEEAVREYQYFKEHFFDAIDFRDPRILRMPIDYGVANFFNNIVFRDPDSLLKELDGFIRKIDADPEVRNYFLRELYFIFQNGDPLFDFPFTRLYEIQCPGGICEGLDELLARRFTRDYKRKVKTLPGKTVPYLEAYDSHQEKISTRDIPHSRIILWFWDADCEDCLEQTPLLHDFYKAYREIYDLEVFAVSITEDVERWERFIQENHLDWINVSYGMGTPNYDFIDYFDLLTTPGIYLINKEHVILERMFPLDDLHSFFEE